MHSPTRTFTVVAGKYDGNEENCKYADSFNNFDAALRALDFVSDYPWHRIEYKGYHITANYNGDINNEQS